MIYCSLNDMISLTIESLVKASDVATKILYCLQSQYGKTF